MSRRAGAVAPGYILIAPKRSSRNERGPMIVDDAGRLVWYLPRRHPVNDLKVVNYRGQRMLAWWEDTPRPKGAHGVYYLMDHRYRIVARVDMGRRLDTDMHELQVTPRGTVLMGSHPLFTDRHSGAKVPDYVIREIDPATRRTLFQWRARGHVPLAASYRRPPHRRRRQVNGAGFGRGVWDYFHGNSIRMTRDGNLIVSARNTGAIYKINRRTGAIMWTLGGRRDSFDLVRRHRRWQFCNQHDATELANGHVLLFDNGSSRGRCPDHPARAEEFALNVRRRKARLVRQWSSRAASPDRRGYRSWYVGSARRVANGDTLVSWGEKRHITEFIRPHRIALDLTLTSWTYRAVRAGWHGTPRNKPAIAARRTGTTVTVWASWNGATRVASWQLLGGTPLTALHPVGSPRPWNGFETPLTADTIESSFAVRALDANGHAIGASRAITVP